MPNDQAHRGSKRPLWLPYAGLAAALLSAHCANSATADLSDDKVLADELVYSGKPIAPQNNTGLCLQASNNTPDNGTPLVLAPCKSSVSQSFGLIDKAIRLFRNQCIDVNEGRAVDGGQVQLWRCYQENTNQRWTFEGGRIQFQGSNKCLDIAGGNAFDGASVELQECVAGKSTQVWRVGDTQVGNTGSSAAVDETPTAASPGVTGSGAVNSRAVDWGSNVLVFDAGMSMRTIQDKLNRIYDKQASNHYGTERYAYFFKPGAYQLDVQIGFFTTAAGLGASPDDTTFTGSVRSKATWFGGNATQNFWRGIENFAVVPANGIDNNIMTWAISQATFMRRVHVRGNLNLWDNGWSSGGFISDSKVDGTIDSGSQQQFLSRDSTYGRWQGSNWNMVFVGVQGSPQGNWPQVPYSVVSQTPVVREKPYIALDDRGAWVVRYPLLKTASQGASFGGGKDNTAVLPITSFYIAHSNEDSADTINAALTRGLHVIFTPGIYSLNKSLQVTYPNTILMGVGLATLKPTSGNTLINTADVDGLTIAGLMLDAGSVNSPVLMQVGPAGSSADHRQNPIVLHDISCRVGGSGEGRATSCLTVNSRYTILDNTWLWRADHGPGAGWWSSPSDNGVTVNGSDVTAYGLFSEHFQKVQTQWNGDNGATYMYQSEFPYDPPNQSSWNSNGRNGYPSYKVADNVTKHKALGMGMYCVFANSVKVENAIEKPDRAGVDFNHLLTAWLGVAGDSEITHIINNSGAAATSNNRKAMTDY